MSKWVTFNDESDCFPERKTKVYSITSKEGNYHLGMIKWYGAWRQYCFFSEQNTVWNRECMRDVEDFMQQLMDERKK